MNRKARKSKEYPLKNKAVGSNNKLITYETLNHSVDSARTLYFHTGTHKTGSKALQAYLATNKTTLGEAGVSYEFYEGSDQSMGNGQYLFEQIYDRNTKNNQLSDLLEFYLAGREMAICSSEDFTGFRDQEWQMINDVCQKLQIQIKFVIFVRDIGPYYLSLHGEFTKSGQIHSTIDDFCMHNQYYPIIDSLKCLLNLFGQNSMTVIHYESAIECLDSIFMRSVGLPPENFDNSALKKTVNRSLTEYEKDVMFRINEASGRQCSHELSAFLMMQRPNLKQPKYLNPVTVGTLLERHTIDVDWLNQTFFGGAKVVTIGVCSSINDKPNALSVEDTQAIDRDVINWCILKLQSVQNDSINFVTHRLRSIDWANASNPVIPEGFDPLAYLLLNTDVLKGGVPPYKHFIDAGQYENRGWEWLIR